MAEERDQASIDIAESAVEQHREFLEERMDPDSGLLDKLLANGNLSRKEHSYVKGKGSLYKRNSLLLNYISEKHEGDRLIAALREAEQTHIANYLNANAEYKSEFGGDWPLTDKEVSILDTNQERLVDLLELDELLCRLYCAKVINKRQMDSISSKPTSHEKNDALIDILRRRSLRDYRQTITCLHQSNQSHVAEILEKGGVVVKVRVNLDGENVTEAENEISTTIANIITNNRSSEEANRILELVNLKVIAARTGQSIILYIYCKTIKELKQLHESLTSGRLKDSFEVWFNRLLTRSQKIAVATLTVSNEEFQQMRAYFKEEEISDWGLEGKHSDDIAATEHHRALNLSAADIVTMRAVLDFDPKIMTNREKSELQEILQLKERRRKSSAYAREQVVKDLPMQEDRLDKDKSSHGKISKILEEGRVSDFDGDIAGEISIEYEDIQNQVETIETEENSITYEEDKQTKRGSGVKSASENGVDPSPMEQKQEDQRTMANSLSKYHYSEDEVNSYAEALTFKRGDKMKTVFPTNIGDSVGWWMVKHLESGQIGFVPRNHVVVDVAAEGQPLMTTINELPLELIDIALQKSYLLYTLSGKQSAESRDEFLINRLSSVDFCWFQRLNKNRFKKIIRRHLSNLYEELRKETVTFRANRSYLVENILAKDLNNRLRSSDCLTDAETRLLSRQMLLRGRMKLFSRDNNQDLLHIIRSFDEARRSAFIRCLHQTNQKSIRRIAENGGVVLKTTMLSQDEEKRQLLEQQLVQRFNDLRDKTKPISHQMEQLISQLKYDDIEIINSLLDRHTVVWLWCQSQTGFERLQKLNESNSLLEVFSDLTALSTSSVDITKPIAINICRDQFKKSVVNFPIFVNFTERLDLREEVWGVTKLRNEIHVLCRSLSSSPHVICVFEDRIPFRLQKKIEVKEIQELWDIESSEKESCLYVSDPGEKCVWKITKKADDQHKIMKWLTNDYDPVTLSASSDGQLLLVSNSSCILRLYGSDAELLHSIQLPRDIKSPVHAVETPIGNFIILHEWMEEEEGERGSTGRAREMWVVSELTRDGQMVISRFISSDETQQLNSPRYLSFDSDDRLFLADYWNHRVILLDSDLKWIRIICPKEEKDERKIRWPHRLCYDEGKKQLIVGGNTIGQGVDVYTLNR